MPDQTESGTDVEPILRCQIYPENFGSAPAGTQQRCYHSQQSGLTSAVGSEKTYRLAGIHDEIDFSEDGCHTDTGGNPSEFDMGV